MEMNLVYPRMVAKKLLPPFIADGVRFLVERVSRKQVAPEWQQVEAGILQGSWLLIHSADGFARRMLDGTYEAPFADAIISKVQPGWVCFDVGAHFGYYSLLLAQLTGPRGEVHAFEPLPYNIDFVRHHIKRNQQADVIHLHSFALADTNGTTILRASNTIEYSCMAVLQNARRLNSDWHQQVFAQFTEYSVEQQSIDSLVEQQRVPLPQLIKVDVEGADLAVFRGAQETMRQAKPIIVAELHTAANAVECTSLLKDLGYQVRLLEDARADWCQILAE